MHRAPSETDHEADLETQVVIAAHAVGCLATELGRLAARSAWSACAPSRGVEASSAETLSEPPQGGWSTPDVA